RAAAIAAGHAPADVDAALAATRAFVHPIDRGTIVRNVFVAYLAVYLILDLLMLINPANRSGGFLGDVSGIGIVILSLALGAGFVASLIWIANPRAFWLIAGVVIAAYGVGAIAWSPLIALVSVGIGGALAVAAVKVGRAGAPGRTPSRELLLLMPILILVGVGGACVVSGLPIPRPA
ncbi:MAG: hypothetical protein L0221_02080, partial [Chloroflexi bacterium]|nr:hypothetical protein [Chloroflexota bacterium]